MTGDRLGRRRVLAATATGLAAMVSGCGYQPAGGELDWDRRVGGSADGGSAFGPGNATTDEVWRSDGAYLYRIRNREGESFTADGWVELDDAAVTAYDSSGEIAWNGAAPRQYEGSPAVANGRAYLPLEDGSVAAVERDEDAGEDGRTSRSWGGDGLALDWTAPYDGRSPALTADEEVVLAAGGSDVAAFDAATGAERFSLSLADDRDRDTPDADAADPVGEVAVAGGRTWLVAGDELLGVDGEGMVFAERSLPAAVSWLAATDAGAVLATDDDLWVIDSDGDRALAVGIDRAGSPAVVEEQDRVYHVAGGSITAVDVDEGAVAWEREDDSFRGGAVADAEGLYGLGPGPSSRRCEFAAVTSEGEEWWAVPPYDDVGCSSDFFLVGDRLVVVGAETLYGFRRKPGRRRSVL